MAWFGLAYARVHELFNLQGFLRVAKNIYSWCWNNGWDISGMYSHDPKEHVARMNIEG